MCLKEQQYRQHWITLISKLGGLFNSAFKREQHYNNKLNLNDYKCFLPCNMKLISSYNYVEGGIYITSSSFTLIKGRILY